MASNHENTSVKFRSSFLKLLLDKSANFRHFLSTLLQGVSKTVLAGVCTCLVIKIPHGQIAITMKQYVNFEWRSVHSNFCLKGKFFSDLLALLAPKSF